MVNVTVYSTPTCPWCKKVKEFLKENKVDFKSVDVSTDSTGAEEMVKKSGQRGVPVTVVGEEVIIGFDEDKLKAALKIE